MKDSSRSFDHAASLARVLAMWSIVACHLGSCFGSAAVGQLFNVGVPLFFVISGWLYGDRREIARPGVWPWRRYLRLEVPALLWLACHALLCALGGGAGPTWSHVVFLLLDLQGLDFVFYRMGDLFVGPWFFTSIMACYGLLLLYLAAERKDPARAERLFACGGLPLVAAFVTLALLGVSADGALAFFAGLRLRRLGLVDRPSGRAALRAAASALAAVALRLACRALADGSLLYDEVVVPLTHVVLACGIFACVRWACAALPAVASLSRSRSVAWLDRISVYVYVCHSFFIGGTVVACFDLPLPLLVQLAAFLVATLACSALLCTVGERVTSAADSLAEELFM